MLQRSLPIRIIETRLRSSLSYISSDVNDRPRSCKPVFYSLQDYRHRFFCQPVRKITLQCGLFSVWNGCLFKFRKHTIRLPHVVKCSENFKKHVSSLFVHIIVGMVLVMTVSVAVSKTPSLALAEEIRLFLEAWRAIDRAYVDKNFNGQSWFRYRENALRNEPMNTREETYKAIRKMLATLDDPFTRQLGTQGSLTGVGLSIGYPTGGDGSTAGLVVISTAPVGPANKAGILSGDVILKIDDASTETMGIYDAADRLQGPEGSAVELTIQSGPEIKHLSLILVSLNPVQSRLCEITGLGREDSKVGYIKLTSFNQNASGAVREAIETLRRNNVNAFVLDLRDNSGGLFPEGIEIAKIWLEKGVIVYICDSQGVRDIYDTDGSNAIAAREPLAVLHKIQSVFELSDGSGLAVTVARYETPAHTDIDKVGVVPDHPLPVSFPKDDQGFCSCLHIATPVGWV
ncbi:unnamed protein product [Camellia sinensis]